jgi:hypothetical protein
MTVDVETRQTRILAMPGEAFNQGSDGQRDIKLVLSG